MDTPSRLQAGAPGAGRFGGSVEIRSWGFASLNTQEFEVLISHDFESHHPFGGRGWILGRGASLARLPDTSSSLKRHMPLLRSYGGPPIVRFHSANGMTQAETMEELRMNLRAAIELWLSVDADWQPFRPAHQSVSR